MKELMFRCCFRSLEMMITRNWKDFTESTRQGCKKTGSGGAGFTLNSTIVNTVLTVKITLKVWYGPVDLTCPPACFKEMLFSFSAKGYGELSFQQKCPSWVGVFFFLHDNSRVLGFRRLLNLSVISQWQKNILKISFPLISPPEGQTTGSCDPQRHFLQEAVSWILNFSSFFPEDKLRT